MSVIPSQIKGFIHELSDMLSADDADFQTPPIMATPTLSDGAGDPLAGKPNAAVLQAQIDAATKPTGFLASVQQTLSGAASSVSSAVSSLTSKLTGGTSSDAAAKASSTGGTSWLLWALAAGGAVLLYLGFAGGKGKKSFFGKLGGTSSVKLR